jgi:Uma2 family endonuclease
MSRKVDATYADIEALPEHVVGEILDGELFVSPRPRPRHAVSASVILTQVNGPFQLGRGGPGGWWILTEPELHLGKNVVVPDIGGWRRERLPVLPESVGIEAAPDWVCEVMSPSTMRIDRQKKLRIYANHGVEFVWLVDADIDRRLVEVFMREGKRWLLIDVLGGDDDDRVRIPPFDAIEIDISAWWLPASTANEPAGPAWNR